MNAAWLQARPPYGMKAVPVAVMSPTHCVCIHWWAREQDHDMQCSSSFSPHSCDAYQSFTGAYSLFVKLEKVVTGQHLRQWPPQLTPDAALARQPTQPPPTSAPPAGRQPAPEREQAARMAWGAPRGLEDVNARLRAGDPKLTALHIMRFRRLNDEVRAACAQTRAGAVPRAARPPHAGPGHRPSTPDAGAHPRRAPPARNGLRGRSGSPTQQPCPPPAR